MERKIGEIFEHNGEWYQCIESSNCPKCDLKWLHNCNIQYPCSVLSRKDGNEVIFKKLEKVGEPTVIRGKPHQKFNNFVFRDSRICQYCAFHHKLCDVKCEPYEFYLEIKQNKEDMEEKNLKPFDLEAAKAGKPVCTRDGRKARIICFDRKHIYEGQDYSIVALINEGSYSETVCSYTKDGLHTPSKIDNNDLMMLPEKKEGWVNIDKGGSGKITISSPYSTKKEAIHNDNECTIDTIKINWSE